MSFQPWAKPDPQSTAGLNSAMVYGQNMQFTVGLNHQVALGNNLQLCINPGVLSDLLGAPASPILSGAMGQRTWREPAVHHRLQRQRHLGTPVSRSDMGPEQVTLNVDQNKPFHDDHVLPDRFGLPGLCHSVRINHRRERPGHCCVIIFQST